MQCRLNVRHLEIDFGDGLPALLELWFADAFASLAMSGENLIVMLGALIDALSHVGLVLNLLEILMLATEAQTPKFS